MCCITCTYAQCADMLTVCIVLYTTCTYTQWADMLTVCIVLYHMYITFYDDIYICQSVLYCNTCTYVPWWYTICLYCIALYHVLNMVHTINWAFCVYCRVLAEEIVGFSGEWLMIYLMFVLYCTKRTNCTYLPCR